MRRTTFRLIIFAPGFGLLLLLAFVYPAVQPLSDARRLLHLASDADGGPEGGAAQLATDLARVQRFAFANAQLWHVHCAGCAPFSASLRRGGELLLQILAAAAPAEAAAIGSPRNPTAAVGRLAALLADNVYGLQGPPAGLHSPADLHQLVRARLLNPFSGSGVDGLNQGTDPDVLGLTADLMRALPLGSRLDRLQIRDGLAFSEDGLSLLFVTTPPSNPFAEAGRELLHRSVATVQRTFAAQAPAAVTVRVTGSHRFAREASQQVRADMRKGVLLSVLGIIVLAWLMSGSPWAGLTLPLPALFGAVAALAVSAVVAAQPHAIVIAFVAGCVGVAVDYPLHLLLARRRVMSAEAVARLKRALWVALLTSVAGLLTLTNASFTMLRSLGWLSAVGLAAAFGAALWLFPLAGRAGVESAVGEGEGEALGRSSNLGIVGRMLSRLCWRGVVPFSLLSIGVAAFLWLLLPSPWLQLIDVAPPHFDGDVRAIDSRTAAAEADRGAFVTAFGDPDNIGLLWFEGADLAGAGEAMRAWTAAATDGDGADWPPEMVEQVAGLARLMPPAATLHRNRRLWCGLVPPAAGELGLLRRALPSLCRTPPSAAEYDMERVLKGLADVLGRPVFVRVGGAVQVGLAVRLPAEERLTAAASLESTVGGRLLHRRSLVRASTEILVGDAKRLWLLALLLLAAVASVGLRSLGLGLMALVPAVLGLATTMALLQMVQGGMNLLSLASLPILLGLGIDYGILVVAAERGEVAERAHSVLWAAATTITGFAGLALADYAGIASLGLALCLGVCAAAAFSLVLAGLRLRLAL